MNVLWCIDKLEPLMPERARHWRKLRDTLPENMRAMLDNEIINTAYRRLGDVRRQMLLSLPPEKMARGIFELGSVMYDRQRWGFGLSRNELMQNLAIFGRSGSGKTNVVFLLLEQLTRKHVPFLFLDWKRTARHLLPIMKRLRVYTPGRSLAPFPFNPFLPPPGLEWSVYIGHVLDVLGDAYTLGDGAKSLLQKALVQAGKKADGAPTNGQVLEALRSLETKDRARGWQISAVRALESVEFAGLGTQSSPHQQAVVARELFTENTVLELDALSQSARKFLAPLLCLWLFYVKLAAREREQLRFVIVVEEAHHLLLRTDGRAKESLMNMLLRQCRELGIGMIVVDQHPSMISKAALGNCYTSICLNLKDPGDLRVAAGISGLVEEERRHLTQLPVGQGIVKLQDRWQRPFVVKFPLASIRKGSVTNGVLSRYLTGSGRKRVKIAENGRVRQIRVLDSIVREAGFALIQDVLTHRDDGVKARYLRLGWSMDKGTQVKNDLVRQGILEAKEVSVGRTRRVLLRVSTTAQRSLGFTVDPARRESLEHEFWKQRYAEHYEEQGWDVELEAARPGARGAADVIARRNGESVGIEVETGKSDVVWNVKQDLLSGFSRVLVVATDQVALRKVERELALAGLVIPSRVRVVLRDRHMQ